MQPTAGLAFAWRCLHDTEGKVPRDYRVYLDYLLYRGHCVYFMYMRRHAYTCARTSGNDWVKVSKYHPSVKLIGGRIY